MPDSPGYDLLGVVVGSEGTLGIATEVGAADPAAPEAVDTLLAAFDSTDAAGDAVSRIIAAGIVPAAIEMMDRLAIEAAEAGGARRLPATRARRCSSSSTARRPRCEALGEVDRRAVPRGGADEIRSRRRRRARALIWKGRKAAFAAMGRIRPTTTCRTASSRAPRCPRCCAASRELAAEYGLRVANVFHAGDGNLHPLVLYDGAEEGEAERAPRWRRASSSCASSTAARSPASTASASTRRATCRRCSPAPTSTRCSGCAARSTPARLSNPGKVLPTPRLCGEVPGPTGAHPLEAAGLAERF